MCLTVEYAISTISFGSPVKPPLSPAQLSINTIVVMSVCQNGMKWKAVLNYASRTDAACLQGPPRQKKSRVLCWLPVWEVEEIQDRVLFGIHEEVTVAVCTSTLTLFSNVYIILLLVSNVFMWLGSLLVLIEHTNLLMFKIVLGFNQHQLNVDNMQVLSASWVLSFHITQILPTSLYDFLSIVLDKDGSIPYSSFCSSDTPSSHFVLFFLILLGFLEHPLFPSG